MKHLNHKRTEYRHVAGFTAACLALAVACAAPVAALGEEDAQIAANVQTELFAEADVAFDVVGGVDVTNEAVDGSEEEGISSEGADGGADDASADSGTEDETSDETSEQDGEASSTDTSAGQESSDEEDAAAAEEEADEKGESEDTQDAERIATTEEREAPKASVVSVVFVGPDYEWARVSGIELEEGATAWDATEVALERSGMAYETGTEVADDVLVSLARSEGGESYGSDLSLGSGWRLYVNGEFYAGSASTRALEDGDEVTWHYEVGTITVSVSVVGPGGTSQAYWIAPTNVDVAATQSAWDASHAVFEQNGYGDGRLLSYSVADDGAVELDSLASLGSNGVTGESWRVYVNGIECEENVAQLRLHAGDSICWYYAGNGTSELPTFAERTGAASQSPATMVRIDGAVAQEWEQEVEDDESLREVLEAATGVGVSGQDGVRSITATRTLTNALPKAIGKGTWSSSLSHLLDDKLYTGQGGRAAWGADGSLYYFSNLGSVVKLTASQLAIGE